MSTGSINEITRINLLYDFYGALLSPRQREVMKLYHEENLSLAEIAQVFGISRQGVHDALKNGEHSLENYEKNLGLVDKFQRSEETIKNVDRSIDRLIEKLAAPEGRQAGGQDQAGTAGPASEYTVKELKKIKSIIDKLED